MRMNLAFTRFPGQLSKAKLAGLLASAVREDLWRGTSSRVGIERCAMDVYDVAECRAFDYISIPPFWVLINPSVEGLQLTMPISGQIPKAYRK
jgi:hypothetical protein